MKQRIWALGAVLIVGAMLGCSGSSGGTSTGQDAAADTIADAVIDTPRAETGTDLVPDALPDTQPELAQPDVAVDAGKDTLPELQPEVGPDTITDTAVDTPSDVCHPDCEGKVCGDDGCGGSCGDCMNWCDPQCNLPEVPFSDPSLCKEDGTVCAQVCCPNCCGKECGPDGCSGLCGQCEGPQEVCDQGQCVCLPSCDAKDCGDDGCGGACGICPGPQDACLDGLCVCQLSCEGKQCGDDGCGGKCGPCPNGEACSEQFQCLTGTWYDETSGLTWENLPQSTGSSSAGAGSSYCSNLSLAGGGWHLPSISELRSLIRGCPETMANGACPVTDSCTTSGCLSLACKGCSKGAGPAAGCYWPGDLESPCGQWYGYFTGSFPDYAGDVWKVFFASGQVGLDYDESGLVRCVR